MPCASSQQGKHDDAEVLYIRAITIGENAIGPDNPDIAVWLNNLGLLRREQVMERAKNNQSTRYLSLSAAESIIL